MNTNTQNSTSTEQDATALMGGIIEDIQHLVKQQMALTRQEIVEDISKAKEATRLYVFGGGVFFLGALLLCLAGVYLLHWATAPAGLDMASIPLWACHAVVGAGLAIVGYSLVCSGETKWTTINPLHNPATDELKKNVEFGLHSK